MTVSKDAIPISFLFHGDTGDFFSASSSGLVLKFFSVLMTMLSQNNRAVTLISQFMYPISCTPSSVISCFDSDEIPLPLAGKSGESSSDSTQVSFGDTGLPLWTF